MLGLTICGALALVNRIKNDENAGAMFDLACHASKGAGMRVCN